MAFTTPQTVINRARRLWYVSAAQYPDATALEDFNIVYKLICNTIISEVDEDYFSDFVTVPFESARNEYQLYDDNVDINKVQKVEVRYSDTENFKEIKLGDKDWLANSLEEYNDEGTTPFYFVFDNSVFVYPAPTAAQTSAEIRMNVSLTPTDLLIWDNITFLEDAHRSLLADGQLPYIYQSRGLLNEKNDAQASFDAKLTDLIFTLSDRVSTPQEITIPNLSYFD